MGRFPPTPQDALSIRHVKPRVHRHGDFVENLDFLLTWHTLASRNIFFVIWLRGNHIDYVYVCKLILLFFNKFTNSQYIKI